MAAYLSDAWLAELHEVAAASDVLARASAGRHLVIEQAVVDGERTVRWHVVLDDGRVAVRPGPAEEPTVRFTVRRDVAEGITRGAESAQRAFMRGDLRVGGDTAALVEHAEALAAIDDAFAPVRATTTF